MFKYYGVGIIFLEGNPLRPSDIKTYMIKQSCHLRHVLHKTAIIGFGSMIDLTGGDADITFSSGLSELNLL